MAKIRSQTGNITIKKEEEDCKPTLGLDSARNITRNKVAKRRPSKNRIRNLPAPQIKAKEDADIKSLLKSASKCSKSAKKPRISQEQINQLIDAIANNNININRASYKPNISHDTASYYYNMYKNNPDKKIPSSRNGSQRVHTQEHVGNLIRYIVGDKMTIKEASAKTNMNYQAGRHYYNEYLESYNIPISHQNYTQDQNNELIDYIVNDKMSITAALKKAKICLKAGRRYCHRYFNDQTPDVPTPSHITIPKHYTQDQIKEVINYIAGDKMTITAASIKADMCPASARNHYRH